MRNPTFLSGFVSFLIDNSTVNDQWEISTTEEKMQIGLWSKKIPLCRNTFIATSFPVLGGSFI